MNRLPRIFAASAATVLAAGVCGVLPAYAANGAAANGTSTLADGGTCATKEAGVAAVDNQAAVPWEISYANTGGTGGSGPTGAGVTVAVIDSGITGGDSQLSGAISGGKDYTTGGNYRQDVDGHGTFVASIIAARPSSKNGMAGIAPGAKLLVYREAGCNVQGAGGQKANDESTLAAAIDTAVAKHAQIINISQAGYVANDTLKAAVLNAYQHNVLIVAAAGNYGDSRPTDAPGVGTNPTTYPAAYAPYLLAVGAATQDGGVADFSESGPFLGVTAPGVAVGGLFPDGKVWTDNGTSFAAPYVAGLAALLVQQHPDWSVSTLMKVLESTAGGGGRWSASAGWGEVNAAAALSADPAHLAKLYGAGPNADGAAAAKPVKVVTVMSPQVSAAQPQAEVDQRKGAYLALGAAVLIVAVAVGGSMVARDARRRRVSQP
jgi:membrane-anchored mycosin MYCP